MIIDPKVIEMIKFVFDRFQDLLTWFYISKVKVAKISKKFWSKYLTGKAKNIKDLSVS